MSFFNKLNENTPPPRTSISKVNLCFNLPFILMFTKKLTQKNNKELSKKHCKWNAYSPLKG